MADSRPWSDHEKNELLLAIIKASTSNATAILFNVIQAHNVQPRWDETALPRGRSLNQCRFAFEDIRRAQPHFLAQGLFGPQTPLSAPPISFKRPFSLDASYPAGREIRPKPFPPPGVTGQPSMTEPPAKRKRGRPTKAQAQAKAAAADASARSGLPPPPAMSPQPVAPATTSAPQEEPRAALPPTTRMPISAVLTPTAPKTASNSSSSSGKRMRTRSTRSEPEGYPMVAASGVGQRYESPYGREPTTMDPSPARTAVMRHREEDLRAHPDPPQFHLGPRSEPPPDPPTGS